MRVEAGPRGVLLPDARIALDTHQPGFTSVCSHAHADHVPWDAAHTHATRETAGFLARRAPRLRVTVHAVGEPFDVNGARVTLLPSGHILGAAMVRVEHDGETLLYTADFKLRESATCAPPARGSAVRCDTLIIESTFGLPIFRFPSTGEVATRVAAFAADVLDEGGVPVFLGYNLGKGHEIAHLLGKAGFRVQLHGAAWNLTDVYRDAGVDFPGAEPYDRETLAGKALVVPPSVRAAPMVTNIPKARVAYCSGWAALENQRIQRDLDALIPASDHADFPDLVTFVKETGARRVIANHGYADVFAHALRTRYGLPASALHVGDFGSEESEDPGAPPDAGGTPHA